MSALDDYNEAYWKRQTESLRNHGPFHIENPWLSRIFTLIALCFIFISVNFLIDMMRGREIEGRLIKLEEKAK